MLGGGTHADSGVWPDGARPVDLLGGGDHWRRQCLPKGPGYGSARPCTRSSEPRPGQSQKESPVDPTEVIASHSDRAAPWRMDLYCTPRSQVMHQAREISPLTFPLPDGHLQGVQGQVGARWPVGGLPADDPPGVHVGHESHIDPPGEDAYIGGGHLPLAGECRRPTARSA